VEELSATAKDAIDSAMLSVSPVVGLELQYLREVGRILWGPRRVLGALRRDFGVAMSDLPFPSIAVRALALTWTRDPFDRLIAAEAAAAGARLLTRDEGLRRHFRAALW
jgi:PIN domain nuclease of toxin-antitoxin system